MAQLGLEYMVCAPLEPDSKEYGVGHVMSHAIKADIKLSFNNIPLWADNRIVDSVKEFKEGKMTLEGDHLSYETLDLILGHKHEKGDGTVPEGLISKVDDEGQFVGVGFYSMTRAGNKSTYRAIWIQKVKFSETGETLETKNGAAKFQTPVIEGDILPDDEGVWKEEVLVKTAAEAKAWLNKKANIVSEVEEG